MYEQPETFSPNSISASERYLTKWTKTFDFYFLVGWIIALISLFVVTLKMQPELFYAYNFFAFCGLKIFVMIVMSFIGGMICRYYCKTDENGYILANSHKWFKVNYTRKLQHFAAYIIPLIGPAAAPYGIIPHLWETLWVLLVFLLLIEPIRTRSTFFMLQFNSMDRPEDRPYTLKWIIMGNILPGLLLSIVAQQVFEDLLHEHHLALIIVLIVGIGDGLAEPVGIHWGKKKYMVPSWNMKKRYIRSYVGSACVYITSIICVLVFYKDFNNVNEFVAALLLIPFVMTLAEAFAPHSMDTPVMMILGYGVLYGICYIL
jgi:hypothetical protein